MESLLTNALEHKDLQFLFLTPLVSLSSHSENLQLQICPPRTSFHASSQFIIGSVQDISAVESAKTKMREKGLEIDDSFVRISMMRAAR